MMISARLARFETISMEYCVTSVCSSIQHISLILTMNSGWYDCCRTLRRPQTNQGHLNQDPLHRFAEWKKTTWHFNLIMDENHYHYFWIHWDRSIDTFFARTQRGYMTSAPTTLQGTSVNKKSEAHVKGISLFNFQDWKLCTIYINLGGKPQSNLLKNLLRKRRQN